MFSINFNLYINKLTKLFKIKEYRYETDCHPPHRKEKIDIFLKINKKKKR